MQGKLRYTRAIIAFVTAFAFFLIAMDFLLVSQEREQLYAEFDAKTKNELSLIGTFVTEPLLEQQYALVEQFILQWGEEKSDILEIRALSPEGYAIAQFKRPSPKGNIRSFRHPIDFMNQNLLTLEIIKDVTPVDIHLEDFWKRLLLQSLAVLGALGTTLWFILKKLALRPLEEEIVRRHDAEHNLQKANDLLETTVIERTSELVSEKEQLAVTLRSIGDGVITTDIEGNIVLINKRAEELTGWQLEEAVGQPLEKVFNIINEITRESCESPVSKVLHTGQIIGLAINTALIAKDGSEKSIADSGAPIRDNESRIIGVVLVFRDVTDQLRMEQEVLKVKKLESIGILAGGIAHDFNNILAAILGNINLALFDPDLKDKTKDLLAKAEKASLRARDLTQQLLTFAKGGEPVKETSSLGSVIKDSANFVLHGDKVACRFEIPEDLWLVDIDKGQISQVIQNIVLNASNAMPEGGIIKISCENLASIDKKTFPLVKEGRFVKLSILDSGIGIPQKLIDKIFDPYFSTKQEGSGLGLAITQSIISKHNGHISVESSSGVGSTFTIYLPASANAESKQKESFAEDNTSSSAKIMIMDDEEMVRNVAQEMLVQLGHEVFLAADGEEAIRLFQVANNTSKKFDLVIMDLTIPGRMGGEEAVKEILAIDPDTKVIVSSGYSNDPIMASYKEYGFCGALVKPYQLQELAKAIHLLLV